MGSKKPKEKPEEAKEIVFSEAEKREWRGILVDTEDLQDDQAQLEVLIAENNARRGRFWKKFRAGHGVLVRELDLGQPIVDRVKLK